MSRRHRLDRELVRRGLVGSRSEVDELLAAHRIRVNGAVADKASRLVDIGDALVVEGPPPRFVSRGGDKLAAALDRWKIDVRGRRALDAGASTGGFTDCLLQAGAAGVVALDVGHGQLHPRIRSDPRVTVIERTNLRHVAVEAIGGPFDVVVADLSFISLTLVASVLVGACRDGGEMVVLVKPQFEVGREIASRGRGVVTDEAVQREVCERVARSFDEVGADVRGVVESPIRGGDGNKEFLLYAVVRARLNP